MAIVLWNPIVGMLFNEKLRRWHPILFVEAPLPGGGGPVRHKSKGHHTDGFEKREDAVKSAQELSEKVAKECSDTGKCSLAISEDMLWDGEDVPASVAFFGEKDGQIVRMM